MWKRWYIIILCLVLIVVRMIWPDVQVDSITIWLVVIIVILFVFPELKTLAPYVKRIKIGDYAEFELKEKFQKLDIEVKKAEDVVSMKPTIETKEDAQKISSDVDKILQESSKDPRAALLLLSSKIEQQLRMRLEEAGINVNQTTSIARAVQVGIKEGVFPPEFLAAFRDFWTIRNQIAHGSAFDVDDAYVLSLISLGTQLLKIASTKNPVERVNMSLHQT